MFNQGRLPSDFSLEYLYSKILNDSVHLRINRIIVLQNIFFLSGFFWQDMLNTCRSFGYQTHPENVTFDEIDSFPEKLSKFFFPCYRQSKYGHSKQIWMFEVPPINSLAIIRYLCPIYTNSRTNSGLDFVVRQHVLSMEQWIYIMVYRHFYSLVNTGLLCRLFWMPMKSDDLWQPDI